MFPYAKFQLFMIIIAYLNILNFERKKINTTIIEKLSTWLFF